MITLEEVLYDQPTGRLALVFELMDANLYELIRGRQKYLNPQLVKSYMWQLMKSLDHMHRKGIFHRDIKPENILIESSTEIGRGLKLADFGSCRGIYSKQPYTEYISTRWYRAPDLTQLNPNLPQLNPNLSQLNLNLPQLNPELTQLNPNLSQLNLSYHNLTRTLTLSVTT